MTKVTEEYRKKKCFDDHEFEVQFFGPSGDHDGSNPVGCKSYFDELGLTKMEIEYIGLLVDQLDGCMRSKQGRKIRDFLNILCSAFRLPE